MIVDTVARFPPFKANCKSEENRGRGLRIREIKSKRYHIIEDIEIPDDFILT